MPPPTAVRPHDTPRIMRVQQRTLAPQSTRKLRYGRGLACGGSSTPLHTHVAWSLALALVRYRECAACRGGAGSGCDSASAGCHPVATCAIACACLVVRARERGAPCLSRQARVVCTPLTAMPFAPIKPVSRMLGHCAGCTLLHAAATLGPHTASKHTWGHHVMQVTQTHPPATLQGPRRAGGRRTGRGSRPHQQLRPLTWNARRTYSMAK